jgi:polyferredoxin
MAKVGRPKGLVRYDSFNGFTSGARRVLRPRIVAYTVLLAAGLTALGFSLRTVKPFYAMVTRMPGRPSYVTPEEVRNQFQLRVVNKRNREVEYAARVVGLPEGGVAHGFEVPVVLPAHGEQVRPFTVQVPRDRYRGEFPFTVEVTSNVGRSVMERDLRFVGPDPALLAGDRAAGGGGEGNP